MKKIAIAAAGIVVLAALVWSGLWFVGRGQVAERLDAEISLLAAQGIEVTHGGREIGGFPFGYRVSHRDVTLGGPASGGVFRFPSLTAEATAADIDRLVVHLPAKFSLEVPLPAAPGDTTPALPATMVFDIEASDLVMVIDGWPGGAQQGSITAQSLLIATGSVDQPPTVAIEVTSIDSQIKDLGAVLTNATTLERLDYAYAGTAPSGAPFTFEGQIDKLVLTGRIQTGEVSGLADGSGTASMTYQTGAAKAAIRAVTGEPEPQGGTLIFSAGSTAGTAAIADGMVEVAASSRADTIMLLPEPMPEMTGAAAKGYGAALRSVEAIYKAPIAPSETMAPFSLRFALDEAVLDAALWGLLDATGALPRHAARLVAEIDGTGRITKNMAEMQPGEAMPLELGNVVVRALDLSAMGASVITRGEVEFLQPINLPQGNLTVKLNGVMQLISKLADTGLLNPNLLQTIGVLAALYSTPVGTDPDDRVSEVAMTLDGITVNGLALGPSR